MAVFSWAFTDADRVFTIPPPWLEDGALPMGASFYGQTLLFATPLALFFEVPISMVQELICPATPIEGSLVGASGSVTLPSIGQSSLLMKGQQYP